jgi:DNA-binding transcriptional LysR family regulator
MELRQVRYFEAVARERSFARAAERLRIAQSGLSQQIMVLERSLGVPLFDRNVRPIELTPEGEVFLEEARRLLELADNAKEKVKLARGQQVATLRFGGSAFGNPPVIDELLGEARTRLSDVDLRIQLGAAAHNIAALERQEVDVVLAYVPFESRETPQYLRLASVELGLALPADHPLAGAGPIARRDIADEPILVGPRTANPPLADHVYRSLFGRPDPPNLVELNDVRGRFRFVAEGAGITPIAMPTESRISVPGVVFRTVEEPVPTIEHGLLWFDDRMTSSLSAFLELAREVSQRDVDRSARSHLEDP